MAILGPRRATVLAERTARLRRRPPAQQSALGEELIAEQLLRKLGRFEKYAVDIGASDGWTSSNTYLMFKHGWHGVAFEVDDRKYAKLTETHRGLNTTLVHAKVTPDNVAELLDANRVPHDFTFLSIDIDGYDYFVLGALLERFRPRLICTEINEKIPPPLRFTVKWDPDHAWAGDHFYGQSISQLSVLAERFSYSIVNLQYNNAFLVPTEISSFRSLSAEQAYREGYAERPDRRDRFPWNADADPALSMGPEEAATFFRKLFAMYEGKYELTVNPPTDRRTPE